MKKTLISIFIFLLILGNTYISGANSYSTINVEKLNTAIDIYFEAEAHENQNKMALHDKKLKEALGIIKSEIIEGKMIEIGKNFYLKKSSNAGAYCFKLFPPSRYSIYFEFFYSDNAKEFYYTPNLITEKYESASEGSKFKAIIQIIKVPFSEYKSFEIGREYRHPEEPHKSILIYCKINNLEVIKESQENN